MCTPILEVRAAKDEIVIIEGLPVVPSDDQNNTDVEELFN